MSANTTATLTFRIDPRLKECMRTTAEKEHRSPANMIEAMTRDYCQHHDVTVPDQQTLLLKENNT